MENVATPGMTVAEEVAATRVRKRIDPWLWGLYCVIVFVAIVELYSASSREIVAGNVLFPALRHMGLLAVGCGIMLIAQKVHFRVWRKYAWGVVGIALLATFYTMAAGDNINSAQRSFSLLGISIQPSEILKFTAALTIARLLGDYVTRFDKDPEVAEQQRRNNIFLLVLANIVVVVFSGLIISQGLTNTVILIMISLALMALAGVRAKHYIIIVLVYIFLGGCGYALKGERSETRKNRITAFLRPEKYNDPITPDIAQEQYSFIAQANGGVRGVGIGGSREASRLPLAFSDYIFAIIVEDVGLIGGIGVIALYVIMLLRAGAIAINCKKTFPALLVLGMALFLVCQALVHIAIVTGAAPVSGEPLPFISKGGSSVLMSSLALGVMLSVSRHAQRTGVDTPADNLSGLTDSDLVDNPTQIKG